MAIRFVRRRYTRGAATAGIGGCVSIVGAGALLALWHDPATLQAIRGSGGLSEAFTLPLMMGVPGVLLGTLGGLVGAAIKQLQSV